MTAHPPDPAPGSSAAGSTLWFGAAFDTRNNSLNLLRLILATLVLFHHSFPLVGIGPSPDLLGAGIGTWAVYAFFTLSGYLITASRFSKSFGDYLTLRIARIFPAFIVCLVVTALVFAPLNYWHVNHTLSGFLRADSSSPFTYVFENISLRMVHWDVAGTPIGVPYAGVWDGSLWSLYYEFVCYLMLGLLGVFAVVRKSPWPIIGVWVLSIVLAVNSQFLLSFGKGMLDPPMLIALVPYFMAGAVLQVLKRKIGMHWLPAVLSAAAFVGLLLVNRAGGGQIGSLFLTYFLLWLGQVLPSPAWVKRNDLSYGMYIYAFPCQQLVMTFFPTFGYWKESMLALVMAAGLAAASWFLLEKPILDRARGVGRAKAAPSVRAVEEVAPTVGAPS